MTDHGEGFVSRILRFLAFLACLSLIVAACGDSGGTTTNGGSDGGQTQATSGEGNGDGNGDGTVTLGTLVDDVPGLSSECVALANVFGSLSQVGLAFGGQADFDVDEVQAQFEDARRGLPDDLQDDIDVLAEAIIGYFEFLAGLDVDLDDPQAIASLTPADLEQLTEAAALFDSEAVQQAGDNLSAYGEAECAVDQ